MCHYYLSLEVERHGRLLSVSFEVLLHSGERFGTNRLAQDYNLTV
jgi:hypothetical protein